MAATGMLGSGFRDESLQTALRQHPEFVGCDAGTSDFGPYYLGAGASHFPRASVKHDLERILCGASAVRIPALIGSAGTCGTDEQVDGLASVVGEVARDAGLALRVARIYCEQSSQDVNDADVRGEIETIGVDVESVGASVDWSACTHIVAMAGAEPFQEALSLGADVVICGRATDSAIYAAVPLMRGVDPGPAWHAGKIVECGAACTERRLYPDCILAEVSSDGFRVSPLSEAMRCTPTSVAAHNLYETESPFEFYEPGFRVDTTDAAYRDAGDGRSVDVSGSRAERVPYSVKLEGAQLVGNQAVFIGVVRDPYIIRELDLWLASLRERIEARYDVLAPGCDDLTLTIRKIGVNAAMEAREPIRDNAHEVGLLFEITCADRIAAIDLANVACHIALHHPIRHWSGLITTLALPHSPAVMDRGPVYRFTPQRILRPSAPLDAFKIECDDIKT